MFSQADQDLPGAEVLVPGRVEDAVGRGQDPLVTDQTGPTQQLLGLALVEHHLPGCRRIHIYIELWTASPAWV